MFEETHYYAIRLKEENSLAHYGIPGMRKGVRKDRYGKTIEKRGPAYVQAEEKLAELQEEDSTEDANEERNNKVRELLNKHRNMKKPVGKNIKTRITEKRR